jgi:hypothetical protein
MEDWWFTKEKVFSIQLLRLSPKFTTFQNIDIISIIEECLTKGIYIYGFYNEKYIPGKSAYKKTDYNHEYIIYGFDSNKKIFVSIGYSNSGKYEEFEISYEDYMESICHMSVFDIYLIELNKDFDYKLDINYIITDLEEYLSSINSREENKSKLYGLKCWRQFIENIQLRIKENKDIDLRHSKLFYEHKMLMKKRLEYLYELGYINSFEMYNNILNFAETAHLLSVKYNMKKMDSIIEDIIELYLNSLDLEEKVLLTFLKEIKEKCKNQEV